MMSIERVEYGTMPGGEKVEQIVLKSKTGMVLKAITYGCRVTNLLVPDKNGDLGDVIMGFDSLDGYTASRNFQGAAVGRYANRIGGAAFSLDGARYSLTVNENKNQLHGGKGFAERVWKIDGITDGDFPSVTFSYLSADGEEGYPGAMQVHVTYSLLENNEWKISYRAVSDKKTVVNLTNHAFFNIGGYDSGDVLEQTLQINAGSYTPTDGELIPTGELLPVKGTPLDFTAAKPIGRDIHTNGAMVETIGGYDHNFVLNQYGEGVRKAAEVYDPKTGRVMEVFTDLPGVQLYTSNAADDQTVGKNGAKFVQHFALCLETQFFPDSPNHPNFPSAVLEAGKEFNSTTSYRFSVR